jgi:hypothetical protein
VIGDLRLARRLIRGAGLQDGVRVVMMAIGIALSVLALMVAVTVPRALGGAADREAARTPAWGDPRPGAVVLTVETSTTAVGPATWTQIRLGGGEPASPIPPGLTRLPAPGHTVVSPALRRLLLTQPQRVTGLGVIEAEPIADSGLTKPDELASYTRVQASAAAGGTPVAGVTPAAEPGPVVVGFGSEDGPSGSSLPLGLEALLLIAVPALLFLSVCARLSVTSRRARMSSLRLIGVSQERCARIFSSELTIISAVAAGLGLLLYVVLQPWLSRGVLGIQWFPSDTRVNGLLAVVVLIASCVATSIISRRSMRKMLRTDERQMTSRGPRGLFLGLALVLIGGGFLFVVVVKTLVSAPADSVLSPAVHVPLVMGATLLLMVGLLVALPVGAARLGQWISTRNIGVSLRLGARLASTQSALGARLVSALIATLMVAGLSSAFLRSTYLDAVGDPSVASLSVDLSKAPPQQRVALGKQLPDDAEIFVVGHRPADSTQRVSIIVTTCARYAQVFQPVVHCVGGPVRVGVDGQPDTLAAGSQVAIDQVDGPAVQITTPPMAIGGQGGDLVIPPADAPWAITSPDVGVTLTVPADQSVSKQAALQRAAPAAVVQQVTKDPASLARYVEQSAVLRSALALAYLLALLTFVFSMVEARWANERSLVAQRALGIPTAVTRRATAFQFAFAVGLGSVLVVPATAASGIAFLAFWGAGNARDPSLWMPVTILACGGVALTVATGWLLGRGSLRLNLLED